MVDAVQKKLGWAFWMLCSMEMWERLAYYGVRVVVPIYIAQADEPGGLHFTQADKGVIYFWWAIVQSGLPSFTGGFADRYGYKNTIFVAITIKVIGYGLMATQRSFTGFFIGCLLLAAGTAIFKPGIQGSLAQTMTEKSSSKGWGIFYWLVNVGAFVGPPLAGMLRKLDWQWVFISCAAIVSLNYLMLFTYKELDSGYEKKDDPWTVMKVTLANLWEARLIAILIILSGFWLMMYQLWDLHPNFIVDWIDSSMLAAYAPEAWTQQTDRGPQVLQENLLNLNAFSIIIFMVPIAIMVARFKTLTAMAAGMIMAIGAVLVSGMFQNGWIFLFAVFLFSVGEMLASPKKLEYFGLIAPPGKKALYLGYVNIPVGIGQGFGALLAAWLYGNWGEKAILSQKYLVQHTDYLKAKGLGAWDGQVATLTETLGGVDRTKAYEVMKSYTGMNGTDATNLLWNTYDPWLVWLPIAGLGLLSTIGLIVFARMARKWNDMNK